MTTWRRFVAWLSSVSVMTLLLFALFGAIVVGAAINLAVGNGANPNGAVGNGTIAVAASPSPSPSASPSPTPTPTGVAVVQANTVQSGTGTATVPWPSATPSPGDVLLACANAAPSSTITATGWTLLVKNTGSAGYPAAMYYKQAGSSEGSESFSSSPSGNIVVSVADIKNGAARAPEHTAALADSGALATGSTQQTYPLTPYTTGALPVACFEGVGSSSAPQYSTPINGNITYYPYQVNQPGTGSYSSTLVAGTAGVASTTLPFGVAAQATVSTTAAVQSYAIQAMVEPSGSATPTPTPSPSPTPTPVAVNNEICYNSQAYQETTGSDEFTNDEGALSVMDATAYSGAPTTWSNQLAGIGRTNNVGTDWSYYSTYSSYFGFVPFTFASNGTLVFTAQPMTAQQATYQPGAPNYSGTTQQQNYLSGVLEGQPIDLRGNNGTYFEFAGEIPNGQGWWPSFWFLGSGSYTDPSTGTTYTNPYPESSPVPLPNGLQELDDIELFGNALNSGEIQSTAIYGYSPSSSNAVRTQVTPNPQTTYHTYGVYIPPTSATTTVGYLQFYVDRVPQGASIPFQYAGPMNPIIILQTFAPGAFAPAPATPYSAITMNLQYFRRYTNTNAACSGGTPVLPAPSAVTTPNPSPSPAATSVAIVQTAGPTTSTGFGNSTLTFSTLPTVGNRLLAIFEASNTAIAVPSSTWTTETTGDNLRSVFDCVLVSGTPGAGQCNPSLSYNFTGNGSVGVMYEIAGSNVSQPLQVATSGDVFGGSYSATLSAIATGGLNLAVNGADVPTTPIPTPTPMAFPTGQAANVIVNQLNTGANPYNTLQVYQITTEAAQGGQPYTASISTSAGAAQSSAQLISVLAAGVTPPPSPSPSPSPSLPPSSPTPGPPLIFPTPAPAPSPTPVVLDSEYGSAAGVSSSAVVTWSAQPAAGQVLVACGIGQFGQSITPPSGWTTLVDSTGSTFASGAFYKVATTGESLTDTFTVASGTNLVIAATRVANVGSPPLFTPTTVASVANATSQSTTAITSPSAESLPLACFLGNGVTSYSLPTNANTTYSALLTNVPTGGTYIASLASGTLTTNATSAIGATSTIAPTTGTTSFAYQFILPTPGPSPSPSPSPSSSPQNFPFASTSGFSSPVPFTATPWPAANAYLANPINPAVAAVNIRSYDSAAQAIYAQGTSQYGTTWDGNSFQQVSGPEMGVYFVQPSDNVAGNLWQVQCNQTVSGFCGATFETATGAYGTPTFTIPIPAGATTENAYSSSNGDHHLRLYFYPHWTPTVISGAQITSYPDVYPFIYGFDVQYMANSTSCNAVAASSTCYVFNGPGTANVLQSGTFFTTGGTGWYSGTNSWNNGYAPSNTPPFVGYTGTGEQADLAYLPATISAEDVQQGAIDHVVGIGMACDRAALTDQWPSANTSSNLACNSGGAPISGATATSGWAANDWLWLDRTPTQICNATPVLTSSTTNCTSGSDAVVDGFNTPFKVMLALALHTYGGYLVDTAGYGPTFSIRTLPEQTWSKVGTQFGLTAQTNVLSQGTQVYYNIDFSLPNSYLIGTTGSPGSGHLHAINPCAIIGNPNYTGSTTTSCGTAAP